MQRIVMIVMMLVCSIASARVSDFEVIDARHKAYNACGYTDQRVLTTNREKIACKKAFYEYEQLLQKQKQEELFEQSRSPLSNELLTQTPGQ